MLIETPQLGFRRIVLSTHKNYVLLLTSLFGIAWFFFLSAIARVSDRTTELLFFLLLKGLLLGPFMGIAGLLIVSTVLWWVGRKLNGVGSFRNVFAVLAYSTFPIVLALCFAFPVKIAVFGRDLFGSNPSPMVIHPLIYQVLAGLDMLTATWCLLLMVEGMSVTSDFSKWRGVIAVLAAVMTFAGLSELALLEGS